MNKTTALTAPKTPTKWQPIAPVRALQPVAESAVLMACEEALKAQGNYALKALIAGQLLCEYRNQLLILSHSGTRSGWRDRDKPMDERFQHWLIGTGISKTTAYRWMEVADRVSRKLLGIQGGRDFAPCIDIESEASIPLSMVMTAPADELPERAQVYRQSLLDFMEDKTLKEALNAAIDGESNPKRVTLAAGGKFSGGAGGDRKAWEVFTRRNLSKLARYFSKKLTVGQKGEMVTALNRALEVWPRWAIEAVAEKSKAELKLDDVARSGRGKL